MRTISKILIANRGEIALRIMRTAKAMNIKTVAVYSDADVAAPHTKFADERVHIGVSAVSASYLDQDKVINAAKSTGADAVHPGYGFLSENATFARAVEEAGLIFIGPKASAIEAMGDKARAKTLMIGVGVPCVPGYEGDDQSDERLTAAANEIGFPVMIKASAGGGGRGMRLVHDAKDLGSALSLARSEAVNAFGDDRLIIEKAIVNPRHVEVQVFGDTHGNLIHLGERDCSVQRRHQKVIEEAPCPVMTDGLRARMGEAAIQAASVVDYVGAGTVEFLLTDDGKFYFLEMNTRLQVEHPVTEMVTGLDLVEMQVRIAEGEQIQMAQDQVPLSGASIEVRLYAENPADDFLPVTGSIALFEVPKSAGIRVDAGVETGCEVSPYYDPMIAKIISTGKNRKEATWRLLQALQHSIIFGLETNRDFLIDALAREEFSSGKATTSFIQNQYGDRGFEAQTLRDTDLILAATLQYINSRKRALEKALNCAPHVLGWQSADPLGSTYVYETDSDQAVSLNVRQNGHVDSFNVEIDGESSSVTVSGIDKARASVVIDGCAHSAGYLCVDEATIHIATEYCTFALSNQVAMMASESVEGGQGRIMAPMHGLLVDMNVQVGQIVSKGDSLCVLEAMKMQHEIQADINGEVSEIMAKKDMQIASGEMILQIVEVKN